MFVPLARDPENAHVTVGNHVTFQPLGWHMTVGTSTRSYPKGTRDSSPDSGWTLEDLGPSNRIFSDSRARHPTLERSTIMSLLHNDVMAPQ